MELKLDAKTLVIGILLGVVIMIVLGVDGAKDRGVITGQRADKTNLFGSSDRTDYGLAVGIDGMALVRVDNGDFYIVNPKSAMAMRVLRARRLSEEPSRANRDYARGRDSQFNYYVAGPAEETDTTGNYGKK
jgi:hypothetical protein